MPKARNRRRPLPISHLIPRPSTTRPGPQRSDPPRSASSRPKPKKAGKPNSRSSPRATGPDGQPAPAKTRVLVKTPTKPGAETKPGAQSKSGANNKSRSLSRPRPQTFRPLDMEETLKARELFWANVIREILCSLADESRRALEARAKEAGNPAPQLPPPAGPSAGPDQPAAPPTPGPPPGMLDGRIAVVTNYGVRIPIAHVKPLFAMGVDRSPETRALSMAVECSVFQILTPKGLVYTLPIHEIRAIRAMSEELMDELEGSAKEQTHPFGFAAFTSLARAGLHQPVELPPISDEGYGE